MNKLNAEKRNIPSRKVLEDPMRLVVPIWIKLTTYQVHLFAASLLAGYLSAGFLFLANFV